MFFANPRNRPMTVVKRRYSKQEFADRGDKIYAEQVSAHLKPADKGKLVAIDIETGEFEVDADQLTACHRLRATAESTNLDGAGWLGLCAPIRRARAAERFMIAGTVVNSEARISFTLRGSGGRERQIEAIVDTGYTGSLTLPPSVIAALGLLWQGSDRAPLADGSRCLVDEFEATVLWDRKKRAIIVDEVDAQPLVGMTLLSGFELRLEVVERGKVTIKRLPGV